MGVQRPVDEDATPPASGPASLADERCVEYPRGTPPLPPDHVARLATKLDSAWRVAGDHIEREFRFDGFNPAFGLATRIALLAEAQDHHPELEVGWGRLGVRFRTSSVGGLSRNDFIMAARIDRMVGDRSR